LNETGKRATPALAVVVFLLAASVYLITLTPTVPFWDSGEFIAVSNILGIPHPPGTPFYVLIGHLFTLVPWATIAQRVNALSALASALAVMLTYLTALRLIRLAQGRPQSGGPAAAPAAAAVPQKREDGGRPCASRRAGSRRNGWRRSARWSPRCCSRTPTTSGRTRSRPRSIR